MNPKTPLSVRDIISVNRFVGNKPAIAYTDFRFVYLSWSLSLQDYDLAFLHEAGHIWLRHNARQSQLMATEKDEYEHHCWLFATDYEIARHLYTAADDFLITRPRSVLVGGVTHAMSLEYPDCTYAEEFYVELKKKKDSQQSACCQCGESEEVEGEPVDQETIKELIEAAKNELKEMGKQKAAKQSQSAIDGFRPPKPSLASEIDRHLGRVKIRRIASYRRPPRREPCDDFLKKGMSNNLQTPHFTLYVDRSGSFDAHKTAQATNLIEKLIKKYRGRVTNDVIYFNDNLLTKDPMIGQGGTNYDAVIENIIKEKAKLAIVITDDDPYHKPEKLESLPEIIIVPVGATTTNLARNLSLKELSL